MIDVCVMLTLYGLNEELNLPQDRLTAIQKSLSKALNLCGTKVQLEKIEDPTPGSSFTHS